MNNTINNTITAEATIINNEEKNFIIKGLENFTQYIHNMIASRSLYISICGAGFKMGKMMDGSYGLGVFYTKDGIKTEKFLTFKSIADMAKALWDWLVNAWNAGKENK